MVLQGAANALNETTFHPTARDIWHPMLKRLYAYWEGLAASGLPARRDIHPSDMRGLLGNIAILKLEAPASDATAKSAHPAFRVKLMGTRMSEDFGRDLTGSLVDDVFPSETINRLHRLIDDAAPYFASSVRLGGGPILQRQTAQHYSALCLPLADDGTTPNQVLVGLYFHPLFALERPA
ncbi:PAS domain-containing protein [Yunchengibacter salinarum]|uniref:PAS domain-containing protein n=1 Tax=Yunchengibacter salinarum TaxID=3133399 RepID=UPI0035B5C515